MDIEQLRSQLKAYFSHKNESYYLTIEGDSSPIADIYIANTFNIDYELYTKTLKTKFNGNQKEKTGYKKHTFIFFNSKQDAENAIDWIKSQCLLFSLYKGNCEVSDNVNLLKFIFKIN